MTPILLTLAIVTMSGCAADPNANRLVPPSPQLKQLFADSDEDMLRRNPLAGIFRGDLRYTATFGEYQSDAYYAAELAAIDRDLAGLARIDRSTLNDADQVSYDTFQWQRSIERRGYESAILDAVKLRPIDHFNGYHTFFADLSSGQGAARFATLKDYEDGLERIRGFAKALDTTRVKFQAGMDAGIVHPKLITRNVIEQLDGFIAQGVDSLPLYAPVRKMPADIPRPDQLRLADEYRAVIEREVQPAYARLRAFLNDRYLPASRDSVGLSAMKGGPALYRYLVAVNTTTSLTPDSIYRLGLSEVARIRAAMEAVQAEVGFRGTLAEFFTDLRTNPKFQPASKEALRDGYQDIGRRVDARVKELFDVVPKAPLAIVPVPAFLEQSQAAGYYQQGTPDGTRPGMFFYNTYDLPSRSLTGMETLYLHEAAPGHHFQISLAQEDTLLPNFQRFGGNNAFVEGWALYAESLGPELGLFTDPYQRFGSLNDEMLRAMRLVVDVGLHEKGWTRDQAITYMLDNSAMGRTDATSEVERYIAMPGQALSYKVGQVTIRRLRTKAEQALGARFDIRAFHAQVLTSGALPLEVLEAKIARWIDARRSEAGA